MTPEVSLGRGHFKKGYTLLELIAAVAIILVVLSMILGGYVARINAAKLGRTVDEMMSLAQASWDYFNSQGHWPATTNDLSSGYMYAAIEASPFGENYQIQGLNNAVSISTNVPTGIAENYYQGTLLEVLPGMPNDTVIITQQRPNEFSGRLDYEKKYD